MTMTLNDFLDSLDADRIRVDEMYYKGFNDGIDDTLDLIETGLENIKKQ